MTSHELQETYIAALCIWREARGESLQGKHAVFCVLRNRLQRGRWGHTFTEVVLAPWQFSSFNRNDPNVTKFPIPEDPAWAESFQVVTENGPDVTGGATHYFATSIEAPEWSLEMEPKGQFGHHLFFKEA